jgi:transitional endoplasmic reticulum ATPase
MCEVLEPGQYFKVKEPEVGFEEIAGFWEVKERLEEMVVLPLKHPETFKQAGLRPPRGILMWGPPNSFATFAEASAKEAGVTLLSAQAKNLVEEEHSIEHLFDAARELAPSLVFISEVEILAPRREAESALLPPPPLLASREATRLLFKCVDELADRDNVKILVSSSRVDILDPALLRNGRVDRKIYVPPAAFEDRLEILKRVLSDVPLGEDVSLEKLAEATAYHTPSQLFSLPRQATLMAIKEEKNNFSSVKLRHFLQALERIAPELTPEMLRRYDDIYKEECKHRYMY